MNEEQAGTTPSDDTGDDAHGDASEPRRRRGVLGRAIASMSGTTRRAPNRPAPTRARRSGRDPMLVGDALEEVLGERGWTQVSALATLQATWPQVVGAELADHLAVDTLDGGVLTLRADSTAWATNVQLMLPALHEAIRGAVGAEAVTRIAVLGPQAPSWAAGPRRVKGRGPRDTYG